MNIWPFHVMAGRTSGNVNTPVQVTTDGKLLLSGTITGGGGPILDGANPAIEATVHQYTNSNPLGVILTDTSGNPLAGSAVSIADGADVAEGSTADAAWSGTGSGSVIAVLKKIATAGGSAVSIADGSDVAEGAKADIAVTGDNSGTVSGKLRGLNKIWADVWDSANHWIKVSIQNATLAVTQSGTWTVQPGNTANTTAWKVDGSAVTQPISAATLPLPSGAATAAKQPALGTAGTASADVISVQGIASMTPLATSVASLPLPAGASTAAKQPALGTAGAASTDVLSVQGIASMTPLKTDGSGVTQPISGSVTANAGTNLNTSALALETGGNLASVASVSGATGDAAVVAGASGSISAKLRSISRDLVANIVLAAGSAIIGKVGIDQTTPGTTDSVSVATGQGAGATIGVTSGAKVITDANGTLQQYLRGIIYQLITAGASFFTPTPSTTGGWTYSLKNGLSNTNSQIKSGQGTLGGWYVYNPNASVAYLQIFDTATGSITVGTTAPKLSIGIPTASAANLELTCGIQFGTAICVAATTTATGGTAPSSALDCSFWFK
jgi:hypothetical protein